MIDDQIGSNLDGITQNGDFIPGSNTRINRQVVNGIKSGISAIDWIKKGQDMHPGKYTFEWVIY
jgi:hypothetical protein